MTGVHGADFVSDKSSRLIVLSQQAFFMAQVCIIISMLERSSSHDFHCLVILKAFQAFQPFQVSASLILLIQHSSHHIYHAPRSRSQCTEEAFSFALDCNCRANLRGICGTRATQTSSSSRAYTRTSRRKSRATSWYQRARQIVVSLALISG